MLPYRIPQIVVAGLLAIFLIGWLPDTFDGIAWRLRREPGTTLLMSGIHVGAIVALVLSIIMNVRIVRTLLRGISFPSTQPVVLVLLSALAFLWAVGYASKVLWLTEDQHLSNTDLQIPAWPGREFDSISIRLTAQEVVPFALFACGATTLSGLYLMGWLKRVPVPTVRIPRWQLAGHTAVGVIVMLLSFPAWIKAFGRMFSFLEMRTWAELDLFENYFPLASNFFTAVLLSVYGFLILHDAYVLRRNQFSDSDNG